MGIDKVIDYSGYVQRNTVYNAADDRQSDYPEKEEKKQERGKAETASDLYADDLRVDIGSNDGYRFGTISFDVRKAISEMERDSMLHEYQYFVGSRRGGTVLVDDADGMVVKV